jgi:hypothetical protein
VSDRTRIDNILKLVQTWPPDERAMLAHEILRDASSQRLPPPPRDTLRTALGALRGNGPVPSDDDVDRIIEEERFAKYGK